MKNNGSLLFSRKQRIIHELFLNGSFIKNLGVVHGKMGIAIYFFHLARTTENHIYEEYAGDLIDEIDDEIDVHTPCNFRDGLAGIGWGINYLVRNNFIEADVNEVLEEFDRRLIHEIEHHSLQNVGVWNGISGFILYFIARITENRETKVNGVLTQALKTAISLFEEQYSNIPIDNGNCSFIEEPDIFDLSWELPWILMCLENLLNLEDFKEDARRIILQLISPIVEGGKLPALSSSCLMLFVVLEKLKGREFKPYFLQQLDECCNKINEHIGRGNFYSELVPQSVFIQHGTTGISFLYNQLYKETNNPIYKRESFYWQTYGMEIHESDQGYAGFFVVKGEEVEAYGIMNGIGGINLLEL